MISKLLTDRAGIFVGDSLKLASILEDNSVDAVVTDPPYELGFMGKSWDASGIAYRVDLWRELLRVLKPGGHLLAFGATRTYHRMTCAIEDAGFEIRDSIHWLYGTGFPKSLDVPKAIDKRREDDPRPVCRFLRAAMDARGVTSKQIAERFGFHSRMVDHWAARDTDSQPTVPTVPQWELLRSLVGFGPELDAEVYRLNGRKGTLGEAWQSAEIVGTLARPSGRPVVTSFQDGAHDHSIRAPATDLAKQWDGWGTALKPAHEPVVMARKPLAGTVAVNVTEFGTGAINVDASRIGDRWPANVLLDDGAADLLGEPSRFFYVAKPGRKERDAGCESLPVRDASVTVERDPDSAGAANPRAGAGRNGGARNYHPTVKPIELMRYLCRLVTPPGGLVLDPFLGSGTTGVAALREGFEFVGVEQSAEYAEIAAARITHALKETT